MSSFFKLLLYTFSVIRFAYKGDHRDEVVNFVTFMLVCTLVGVLFWGAGVGAKPGIEYASQFIARTFSIGPWFLFIYFYRGWVDAYKVHLAKSSEEQVQTSQA